jgi:aarF domain-containing kinase
MHSWWVFVLLDVSGTRTQIFRKKMLLLDNFVHADLHPGNIMIKFFKPQSTMALLKSLFASIVGAESSTQANDLSESDLVVSSLRGLSKKRSEWIAKLQELHDAGYIPELVFVDAGLVTTLSATNRKNFIDLFRAIAEFDGYRTGQLMISRSRSPEMAIDAEIFALKMQNIVLSVKRKTFSLGQIKISDVLRDVLKAVREHHVKLEGDFVNTVISVLLLEGIGRRLDPELDLFKSSLPILRQVGGSMAAEEGRKRQIPSGEFGALLKFWILIEARSLANAAFVNFDDLIKYDW